MTRLFMFQIRRIKEDVEYYIESSQEPDFEENEYIYDDIIGLDEVELSGVGLPSSATTDSNNSNETGGTPTSLTSGASPIPSPSNSAPLHNHSSDSSTESADKKKKLLDDSTTIKPVKPTAVRATSNNLNSSTNSMLNTSTSSVNSMLNSSLSSIMTNSLVVGPVGVTVGTVQASPAGAVNAIGAVGSIGVGVACATGIGTNIQPPTSNKPLISSTPSKQHQSHQQITSNNNSPSAGMLTNHLNTSGNFAAVAAANTHLITGSNKHSTCESLFHLYKYIFSFHFIH